MEESHSVDPNRPLPRKFPFTSWESRFHLPVIRIAGTVLSALGSPRAGKVNPVEKDGPAKRVYVFNTAKNTREIYGLTDAWR